MVGGKYNKAVGEKVLSCQIREKSCKKDCTIWIKIMVKYAAQLIGFVYPSKLKINYSRHHDSNLGVLK